MSSKDDAAAPMGLPETDAERLAAWLMRAGLSAPAWCATDPRLDAACVVVCAALDSMADARGIVRADVDALAETLRLMPNEPGYRIEAPLRRLEELGIVRRVATGGWWLRRLAIAAPLPLDEAHPDELTEWALSLTDEDRAAVLATLAAMRGTR